MPYRTELRRPDLKGTFRCSLCNKIFCHSSSLSRHRMQTHFKSYTCTLCNKEITSNETLRAHMYKKHQISRMFMCRCCNWAFPDKTSLHIHMQAMANGNPGNVSIIAKSSSSPLAHGAALVKVEMGLADDSMNNLSCPNMPLMDGTPNSQESGVSSPAAASSIFPNLNVRDDLINRLRERAMIGNFVGHPPAASVGAGGLDIASLFPNFAKLNSNFFGATPPNFHRGGVPTTTTSSSASPSANNFAEFMQNAAAMKAVAAAAAAAAGTKNSTATSLGHRFESLVNGLENSSTPLDGRRQSKDLGKELDSQNGENDDEEMDDDEAMMADVEYGSFCDEDIEQQNFDHRPTVNSSSPISPTKDKNLDDNCNQPQPIDQLKALIENNNNNSQISSRKENTNNYNAEIDRLKKDEQLRYQNAGLLHSSPLNSLLYQKKLSNVLRGGKRESSSFSLLNNLIHQKTAAAAAFSTPSPIDYIFNGGTPKATPPAPIGQNLAPNSHFAHQHQHLMSQLSQLSPDDTHSTSNSHISPTDSTSTKSSSSLLQLRGAGGTSPGAQNHKEGSSSSPLASPSSQCFQCQVFKGKLAQAENRSRFLESRTTSQESKISRLESRVGTLESNNRRYETEAVSLRDHCELLERKILDCQERALKYLSQNEFDAETTKKILHDVIETCRVYGASNGMNNNNHVTFKNNQ